MRANELCPETAAEMSEALVTTLVELGRRDDLTHLLEAPPTATGLTVQARQAAERGLLGLMARSRERCDEAERARMQAAFSLGLSARDTKRYAEAKAWFLDAWSLCHPNGEALFFAGLSAQALNNQTEAQRLLDRSVVELEQATGTRVAVERAAFGKASGAAWSGDSRYFATDIGEAVSVRDRYLGLQEVMRLNGEGRWLGAQSVAFSRDGKRIAVGGHDNAVRVWDVLAGKQTRRITPTWARRLLTFSPDGTILAGAYTGNVEVWSSATGKQVGARDWQGKTVEALAFSPDGGSLAAGLDDGTVHLWKVAAIGEEWSIAAHKGSVLTLAFTAGGEMLASGSNDGSVRWWDVGTGRDRGRLGADLGSITDLVFGPNDRTLVSLGVDELDPDPRTGRTVRVWDAQTRALVIKFHTAFPAHASCHRPNSSCVPPESGPRQFAISPDGRTIASTALRLWDVTTGQEMPTRRVNAPRIEAVAIDGLTLASSEDDAIRLWRGLPRPEVVLLRGHVATVNSLVFSPDGQTLASGAGRWGDEGEDNTLRLWDTTRAALNRTLVGHTGAVTHIAFSADGRLVASGSVDATARVWQATTGNLLGTFSGDASPVSSVAFSPDGQTLLAASSEAVRRWDVRSGVLASEPVSLPNTFAAFAPSRSTVVAAESGGVMFSPGVNTVGLRVVDTSNRATIRTLTGPANRSSHATISPNGDRVAAGVDESLVGVWDMNTGVQTERLCGHTEYVTDVAFAPSGRVLASASKDGSVRLWAFTGAPMVVLLPVPGHDAAFVFTESFPQQVEVVGADAGAATSYLTCRFGPLRFPFELCRERVETAGLLAKTLAGEELRGEP